MEMNIKIHDDDEIVTLRSFQSIVVAQKDLNAELNEDKLQSLWSVKN